ncbi:hypothetical protein ACUXPL_001418 [Micrococcus sp. 140720015-1]
MTQILDLQTQITDQSDLSTLGGSSLSWSNC